MHNRLDVSETQTKHYIKKIINICITYMLFTGCEDRMKQTVPEVLKTARARRARDVFKTEGTVFLIQTEAAQKNYYPELLPRKTQEVNLIQVIYTSVKMLL